MEARGWLPGDLMPYPEQKLRIIWGLDTLLDKGTLHEHPILDIQIPIDGDSTTLIVWVGPREELQRWEVWDWNSETIYSADGWPGLDAAIARARLVWAEAVARDLAEQAGA